MCLLTPQDKKRSTRNSDLRYYWCFQFRVFDLLFYYTSQVFFDKTLLSSNKRLSLQRGKSNIIKDKQRAATLFTKTIAGTLNIGRSWATMNESNIYFSESNKKKIELINELIKLLELREPIDYSHYNPSINPGITIEEIAQENNLKEIEVQTLQASWEQLEGLLFNDLQITLQEKNQLYTYQENKRKGDKQKQKSKGRRSTQVWRADE